MNKKYMERAIKLANKAYKKNEVPIGAVIVQNNKIIGYGFNQVEKKRDSTAHAEMLAIKQAQKKNKSWRLNDCTLYVTLQPCMMCIGAIVQARIKKIVYSTDSNYLSQEEKKCANIIYKKNNIQIERGIFSEESKKLLALFFKEKRK